MPLKFRNCIDTPPVSYYAVCFAHLNYQRYPKYIAYPNFESFCSYYDYLFLLPDSSSNDIVIDKEVVSSGYHHPGEVICRTIPEGSNRSMLDSTSGTSLNFLNDSDSSTCAVVSVTGKQLQVVFHFSYINPISELSVVAILKHANDCNAPTWTLFGGTDCRQGMYTECYRAQLLRVGEFTHCILTCNCLGACDYLYLMFHRVPWQNQTEQLCEIWVR